MALSLAALAGSNGGPPSGGGGGTVAPEDVLRVASGGIGGLGSLEALGHITGSKLAERLRAAQVWAVIWPASASLLYTPAPQPLY